MQNGDMFRYVVLRHETGPASKRPSHWDLMFEQGGVLRTWACEPLPNATGVAAQQLPDHRIDYLDYEGPLSGDRGSVSQWDAGTYCLEHDSNVQWTVRLMGGKLTGQLTLHRLDESATEWMARLVPS
jgi:hypothetical protein